jgi:hypothetical protein
MFKYVRMTIPGEIFLDQFLKAEIEHTNYSIQLANLLLLIKNRCNEKGIAKIPKPLIFHYLIAYEGLKVNKLIEEITPSIEDKVGEIVERKLRNLDYQDKERRFRMGFGLPFLDDEDDDEEE